MAEGGFEELEMKDLEQEREQEREQEEEQDLEQEEEETNIDHNVLIRPNRPKITRVNNDNIPDVRKDIGTIRRAITSDVKKSFKNIFNTTFEKKNGPNSRMILDYTKFKTEPSGTTYIEYKDKKVGRVERGVPNLYSRRNGKFVTEFKNNLFKANEEYLRTPSALVEDTFGGSLPTDTIDNIIESSIDRISGELEDVEYNVENNVLMTKQDLRELVGVFNPKGATAQHKIDALEIQADHWRDRAQEADPAKEKLYESLESAARLQADNIRLKNNERPVHEETVEIINKGVEESDLGRLERFKRWARENLLGLSAIAITIAGIVTTVVLTGRKTVKQVGGVTKKLAKALVNVGKKLGPLIGPLLNLLAQAVTWGAKGIEFLSKNLWLLSIALAYIMYDFYRNRK